MIQAPRVLPIDTLLESEVTNIERDRLGKIENFGLDLDRGRIAYAVLSLNGLLAASGRYIAVPWEALSYSHHDGIAVVNGDEGFLKDAPGFTRDTWPDADDRRFVLEVYRYYGWRPYWEVTRDRNA